MLVELYEALKNKIGTEATRMLLEALPESDYATKSELSQAVADLRDEMRKLHIQSLRWMLALFLPMWATTTAALVALLLRG